MVQHKYKIRVKSYFLEYEKIKYGSVIKYTPNRGYLHVILIRLTRDSDF